MHPRARGEIWMCFDPAMGEVLPGETQYTIQKPLLIPVLHLRSIPCPERRAQVSGLHARSARRSSLKTRAVAAFASSHLSIAVAPETEAGSFLCRAHKDAPEHASHAAAQ